MSDSPFKVRLKALPTHRRIEVDGAFVARALAGMALRDALEAPADDPQAGRGVADVDAYTDAEGGHGHSHVFVSGKVEGALTVACSRCVGPVTVPLSEQLHVVFVPRAEHVEKEKPEEEGEVELAEDDLDVFPYDGDAIDLEPLVREQFILAVPFAPLCREDCKGLCPMCGIDRNVATCACEKPVDPRFAALEALKKGLKPTT